MKILIFIGICCFLLFTAGCTSKEEYDQQKKLWAGEKNLYFMSMGYLGENESDERMEDVCGRYAYLFQLLEENKNGFIMDADNYRGIDDAGTPAYTKGDFYIYPEEISPEGRCIRMSKNYFKYNAVDDWEGNPVEMKQACQYVLPVYEPEIWNR